MAKICVIGSSSVDLVGKSAEDLKVADSNIGSIEYLLGGVARNISENLFRMGSDVRLLTFLANDEFSDLIKDGLEKVGIEYHFLSIPRKRACRYVAIHDCNGDLVYAINDFSLMDSLELSDIEPFFAVIEPCEFLVLDANLPEKLIIELAKRFTDKRICIDGVSQTKVIRIKGVLDSIDTLKVNYNELCALIGDPHCDTNKAMKQLISKGVRHLIVTSGKHPIAYNIENDIFTSSPNAPINIVSTIGAGDALFSGVIYGLAKGNCMHDSIQIGKWLASLTLETHFSCNPNLDISQLKL